jgi:aspartate aminotransferase
MSFFRNVDLVKPDAAFHITDAYNADSHLHKVNLSVDAYKDEEGKPCVLPVVRRVEAAMACDHTLNHEYLPITGLTSFTDAVSKLLLGSASSAIVDRRVCTVQSMAGTGALRLAADFLMNFYPVKTVYVSRPTFKNHMHVFRHAGFSDIREYHYVCEETYGLDLSGMIKDLENAPEGSVVILQVCAHNPTGIDPSQEHWQKIQDVCKRRQLCPVFICTYQGLASGDVDKDVWPVRHFADAGIQLFCCVSFSRNFGLYNECAGCLSVVTGNTEEAVAVRSQLQSILESMLSNPPNHGSRIVTTILNNPALFAEWKDHLRTMSVRMKEARRLLYERLAALGTPGSWNHILEHVGMFTFTGLECENKIN